MDRLLESPDESKEAMLSIHATLKAESDNHSCCVLQVYNNSVSIFFALNKNTNRHLLKLLSA